MFVIPCKFERSRPVIFDCVRSIRLFHNDPIVIVDSDSNEKHYGHQLSDSYSSVFFEDCKNINYELGALSHVYKKFSFPYYYLLHDSMMLQSNIDHLKQFELTTTRFFYSWNGVLGSNFVDENMNSKYRYGFDNQQQKTIAESWNMNAANIELPYLFDGVFGSSFFSKKETLDFLVGNGLFNSLPTSKLESQAMERYLGMFFTHFKFDFTKNSLLGEHHISPFESRFIKKLIMGRQ